MKLWLVTGDFDKLDDSLFEQAILLVDAESQSRIRRFYHKADSWRTLIGRLLPRMMLRELGVSTNAMSFGATEAGKPYVARGVIDPPVAFNISHDGALVALAFSPLPPGMPAPTHSIGVDIMRVRLPPRETLRSFVGMFAEQLAPREQAQLARAPESKRLEAFYRLWTIKEAYTKALGLGLGFDFARVVYDEDTRGLEVDGVQPRGWTLHEVKQVVEAQDGQEDYIGVVAERDGGDSPAILNQAEDGAPWLQTFGANDFLKRALEELSV